MNVRTIAWFLATLPSQRITAFAPSAARHLPSSIPNNRFISGLAAPAQQQQTLPLVIRKMSSSSSEPRKVGVATPEELQTFVTNAGPNNIVIIDVRNPDSTIEPGDAKSFAVAQLPNPSEGYRPRALSLIWDRATDSMPLPPDTVGKDTPMITHCGGGGRGQKAKEFLEKNGFTNVVNGGGPKEKECWSVFGDL